MQAWLDGVRDSRRRRELAADHRDRARAALILHDRVAAMREASSAVALDPGDDAAAEILGRLVLEPPAPDAPGVAAIVEASDGVEIRAQALVAARSYLAIPLFLPLLWWLGIHAAAVPLAVAALGSAAAAVSLLVSRGRWLRAWVWVSLAGNAVMMVLFSRMFGPLLAVPAMASTLGMTAMTVPGLRPWPLLPVLLVAAVLGPWAAEALGWLQPTTWIEHDALVVTSSVIDLPRGPTLAVLAIHTVTLTAIAAHYMRQLTQVNRDARLRLLSQAWLLEQLAAGDDGAA
ncbi:MAG: hypothetical protein H6708_10370 [Kofleriaceae bacterium]|nr:hypothetical protein [Kofleriaceae bacterium]